MQECIASTQEIMCRMWKRSLERKKHVKIKFHLLITGGIKKKFHQLVTGEKNVTIFMKSQIKAVTIMSCCQNLQPIFCIEI